MQRDNEMKTLTEMQKNFIIKSALNNGKSEAQALEQVAAKEAKINKPKKQAFNWSNFNDEDESGMMY